MALKISGKEINEVLWIMKQEFETLAQKSLIEQFYVVEYNFQSNC